LEFGIPEVLRVEHKALHEELAKAAEMSDGVGAAAKAVSRVLNPHFAKEEEFALPPLGLLSDITRGRITIDMRDALKMTDKLKAELPRMLEENKAIAAELKNMSDAALREKKVKYIRFAEKILMHTRAEEELYYPTAILVGEYLKRAMGLQKAGI
jgi:hypothetical protein